MIEDELLKNNRYSELNKFITQHKQIKKVMMKEYQELAHDIFQFSEIRELIREINFTKKIIGISFDTTTANTGRKGGFNERLQHKISAN